MMILMRTLGKTLRKCRGLMSLLTLATVVVSGLRAAIPEPDIVFYGRVMRTAAPQPGDVYALPEAVSQGVLTWTLSAVSGPAQSVTVQATLAPIPGSAGPNTAALGYRVAIPVTYLAPGEAASLAAGTVAARDAAQLLSRASVTLDGQPVWIVTPTGGTATQFSFGVRDRGLIERVDLALAASLTEAVAVADRSGSGLPDWFEEHYAGYGVVLMAGRDSDGDGVADEVEFRRGDDPYGYDYETFCRMHGLTGADADPMADLEPDGFPNILEFALGGNPRVNDAAWLRSRAALSVATTEAAFGVEKPFPERPRPLGVSYRLEQWDAALGWQDVSHLAVVDDLTELRWEAPMSGGNQGALVRLGVSLMD